MSTKPIKRNDLLQPFSREHHHALLLCWKIKEGFKRNVAAERIKQYTNWFWDTYLNQHFLEEEKYLFPILAANNPLIIQAFTEHNTLRKYFEDESNVEQSLKAIANELDAHIRFEERVLFNAIQEAATANQLSALEQHNKTPYVENWEDHFWGK
ncbi:MAG: hemerythrin domain-containing protein [Bacteroidetes bacterium]|nr:hemerythrin domain-containing protein [Bacteroidota bacterium]MBS1650292.1 hemerythrin domain-containing protein [Bacteroidota bacterium]